MKQYNYLHIRRTKIIATIGPASNSAEMIKKILYAGVNIFRVNFSHGDPLEHIKLIKNIRKITNNEKLNVSILADLCGPKIRVGKFENGAIELVEGAEVFITPKNIIGSAKIIPVQYSRILNDVKISERILLNDGALELTVIGKTKEYLKAKVLRGGILKDKKGMNLPDSKLKISALTLKDKKDVEYCIEAGVDFIALSFVRFAKDVIDLKKILKSKNVNIPIISKIEKPEALDNIKSILDVSDGIMIARGDLGVEFPAQKVPLIQNELINYAIQSSKPVIVATQMLETMIEHSTPTRAEVTDVAAACLAGADAVMLSGETAVGKYPLETVKTMDAILREAEAYLWAEKKFFVNIHQTKYNDILRKAISISIAQLSRDLDAHCIAVLTRSGDTARIVSADRPAAPIIAFTKSEKTYRQMNLLWGVFPFLVKREFKFKEYINYAQCVVINELKIAKKNDYIILLSGLAGDNTSLDSIVIHKIT